MAYDEKAATRVRQVLSEHRAVVERKMMGGLCFMLRGHMCCGVTGSALMVRVGADAYAQALTRSHVRPLEFAGRRPSGFVLIDPAGFTTKKALVAWVQRGIDVVAKLPPKKR